MTMYVKIADKKSHEDTVDVYQYLNVNRNISKNWWVVFQKRKSKMVVYDIEK